MDAGRLTRLIAIQSQASGQDDNGQPNGAWSTICSPWASIRNLNGIQAIRGGAEASIIGTSIRIRYRTNVEAGMRAVDGSTTYQIKAVLQDETGHEFTDLVCEVMR